MYDTRTISAEEYIPMNVYRTILLWVGEIYQISKIAKTSVNKRLFYYVSAFLRCRNQCSCLTSGEDGMQFYAVGANG